MNEKEWLLQEKYKGEETAEYHADCIRLNDGEPLGYVIGHVPFLNTTIYLDSHPLIPRTETEYWVEKVMEEIKSKGEGKNSVLDLCAGSGCIGVALLKAFPHMHADFGEIDPAHISTIEKNIELNGIPATRTQIIESDLFSNIPDSYDYIITNPPYIDPALDRTQKSVKLYEPHQALYGGEGGIALITEIIKEAPFHLNPYGKVFIEHEPEQMKMIHETALQNAFVAETFKDQYGVFRYTRLSRES